MMLDFLEENVNTPKTMGMLVDEIIGPQLVFDGSERTPKMRGAELAAECMRLNTFRLHNSSNTGLTGFSVIAAGSGIAVEDIIRKNLLKNNPDTVLLWDEFIPKTKAMGLNYSGKLDFLLNVNGTEVVVDIKTTTRISPEKRIDIQELAPFMGQVLDADMFDDLNKTKGGIRGTTATINKYVEQVIGYCTFLDVDHAVVYILSRSKERFNEDYTFATEHVVVTDEMKYDTICRMMLAQNLAKQDRVPAKPEKYKKTTTCKYCDFWDKCWTPEVDTLDILTGEATQDLYDELYPEAVELYEQHRGTLAWIKGKKIEEAQLLKKAIGGDLDAIQEVLKRYQVNIDEVLLNCFPAYDMHEVRQFSHKVNMFCRECNTK